MPGPENKKRNDFRELWCYNQGIAGIEVQGK